MNNQQGNRSASRRVKGDIHLWATAMLGVFGLFWSNARGQDLSFSEVPDRRFVIVENEGTTTPLFQFILSNSSSDNVSYTLSDTGFSFVNDLALGSIAGNSTNIITARVPLHDVAPGLFSPELTATPAAGDPAVGAASLYRVQNRELQAEENLNLGRFIRGEGNTDYSVGTFTVNAGAAPDSEATRVTALGNDTPDSSDREYHFGDRTVYQTDRYNTAVTGSDGQGLVLKPTSSTNVILDSSNETASYHVEFRTNGTKSVDLSGNDLRLLFRTETLPYSELDLEDVSLSIEGTALENREFSDIEISLGRAMVDQAATHNKTGSETVSLVSSADDDVATRVQLSSGAPVANAGISVSADGDVLFNGTNTSANLTSTYDVNFDGTVSGRQTRTVDLSPLLSSGEDSPLANEELTGELSYTFDVVEQRQFTANDVTERALVNETISSFTGEITSNGSDEQYTRATVLGQQFTGEQGANRVEDSFSDGPYTSAAAGVTQRGTRSHAVTGEGLDGEGPYDNVEYDYYTQFYDPNAVQFTQHAGSSDSGNPTEMNADDTVEFHFLTGENDAPVASPTTENSEIPSDTYIQTLGFGRVNLSNNNGVYSFSANSFTSGGFGGTFTTMVEGAFSHREDIIGQEVGDLGTYYWSFEKTVAPGSGPASTSVASGYRISGIGVNSTGTDIFSESTSVNILDSNPLKNDTILDLNITSATDAVGENSSSLTSQVANLSGLDGNQFVLQLSYDEDYAVNLFGSEESSVLLWFDPENSAWVNAVLGNSDMGAGASRFFSSYDDYLMGAGGDAVLGAFGVDTDDNTVWAVLDHNSSFAAAAIPEPESLLLAILFLSVFGIAFRKRIGR